MAGFAVVASALFMNSQLRVESLHVPPSGPVEPEDEDYMEDIWELKSNWSKLTHGYKKPLFVPTVNRDNQSQWQCNRSRYIQPSPEDIHMGNTKCADNHVLGKPEFSYPDGHYCQAKINNFGKFMEVDGKKFMWIEILKCGSRTFHDMLEPIPGKEGRDTSFQSEEDAKEIYGFAMVRHPVTRFISAYGTIMHRIGEIHINVGPYHCLTKELKNVLMMTEPARFDAFVDLYIKHGINLIHLYSCPDIKTLPAPCIMSHALSQTWYLNLWPGKIDHMMKAETWDDDVRKLESTLGMKLNIGTHQNTQEGHDDQLRALFLKQKSTIQKLHDYLRNDIKRFGYTPLTGWH